jgi:peptidoglycan/xylan/chitin deacetylase (PgdA/CDA1 family)
MRIKIAITFDDAYKRQYYVAALLASKGIKATFFVPACCRKHPIDAEPLLSLQEVKEISRMGHEIGSHGCRHINLLSASYNEVLREVRDSKKLLEEATGREVYGFAYPYGFYNSKIIDLVKQYYEYAVTVHLKHIKSCKKLVYTSRIDGHDRYTLCRLAPKSLFYAALKLLSSSAMKAEEVKIILVFHDEEPWLITTMLNIFRNIFNARFYTVKGLPG